MQIYYFELQFRCQNILCVIENSIGILFFLLLNLLFNRQYFLARPWPFAAVSQYVFGLHAQHFFIVTQLQWVKVSLENIAYSYDK